MRVPPLSSLSASRDAAFSFAPELPHETDSLPDTNSQPLDSARSQPLDSARSLIVSSARTKLPDSARTPAELLESARSQNFDSARTELPAVEWAQPLFSFDVLNSPRKNSPRKKHTELGACTTDSLSKSSWSHAETCRSSQGATIVTDPLSKSASHGDMPRCSQGVIHIRDSLCNSPRSSETCGHAQDASFQPIGHPDTRTCRQSETNITDTSSNSANQVDILKYSQGVIQVINVDDSSYNVASNIARHRSGDVVNNIRNAVSCSARSTDVQSCSQGETNVRSSVSMLESQVDNHHGTERLTDVEDALSNSRCVETGGYDQAAADIKDVLLSTAGHMEGHTSIQQAISSEEPSSPCPRHLNVHQFCQEATNFNNVLSKPATRFDAQGCSGVASNITDPLSKSTSQLEMSRCSQGDTNVKDGWSHSERHLDMRGCSQVSYHMKDALSKSAGHVELHKHNWEETNSGDPSPKYPSHPEMRGCRGEVRPYSARTFEISGCRQGATSMTDSLSKSTGHLEIERCSRGVTNVKFGHSANLGRNQQTGDIRHPTSPSVMHMVAHGCSQELVDMKDTLSKPAKPPRLLIEMDIENCILKERVLKQVATNTGCSTTPRSNNQESIVQKWLLKDNVELLRGTPTTQDAHATQVNTLQFLKRELHLCKERQNELRQSHEDRMRGLQNIMELEQKEVARFQATEQVATAVKFSEAEAEFSRATKMQEELQQELNELQSARSSQAATASKLTSEIEGLELQLQAIRATCQQRECMLEVGHLSEELAKARHIHHDQIVEGEAEIDALQRDLSTFKAEVHRGMLDTVQEHCKMLHLAHQKHQKVVMTPRLIGGLRNDIKQCQLELERLTALEEAKGRTVQELRAELTTSRRESLRQFLASCGSAHTDKVMCSDQEPAMRLQSVMEAGTVDPAHSAHKNTENASVAAGMVDEVTSVSVDETRRTHQNTAGGKLIVAETAAKAEWEEPCIRVNVERINSVSTGAAAAAEGIDKKFIAADLKESCNILSGVWVVSVQQDADSRLVDPTDDLQCCHLDTTSELSTVVLPSGVACTSETQIFPSLVLEPCPSFEEKGKNEEIINSFESSHEVVRGMEFLEAERLVKEGAKAMDECIPAQKNAEAVGQNKVVGMKAAAEGTATTHKDAVAVERKTETEELCQQATAKVPQDEHTIIKKKETEEEEEEEEETSDAYLPKNSRSCTGSAASALRITSTPLSSLRLAAPLPSSSHRTMPLSVHTQRPSQNDKSRDTSLPVTTSHHRPVLTPRLGASPRKHSLSPRRMTPRCQKASEMGMKSSKDKAALARELAAKSICQDRVVADMRTCQQRLFADAALKAKQHRPRVQKNVGQERSAAKTQAEHCKASEEEVEQKRLVTELEPASEEQCIFCDKKMEQDMLAAGEELMMLEKKHGKELPGTEAAAIPADEPKATKGSIEEKPHAAEALKEVEDEEFTTIGLTGVERPAEVVTDAEAIVKAAEDRMTAVEKALMEMPALMAAAKAASHNFFVAKANPVDAAFHRRQRQRTWLPVLQQRQARVRK